MPSPSLSPPSETETAVEPRIASCSAVTSTRPLPTAVTSPSADTVAMRGLVVAKTVPAAAAVTSEVEPSGRVAVAVTWRVAPGEVSVAPCGARLIRAGVGGAEPSAIGEIAFMRSATMGKNSEAPLVVTPSSMHVSRARTGPIFEGTLAMSQEPSGRTLAVWLRMLTVHKDDPAC